MKGERMTVTRSMKISNKRGKPSFENLDATINFEGDDQKTISKRCVDVDAEMCHFMGKEFKLKIFKKQNFKNIKNEK